jgi:hypothetical protein
MNIDRPGASALGASALMDLADVSLQQLRRNCRRHSLHLAMLGALLIAVAIIMVPNAAKHDRLSAGAATSHGFSPQA